PRQHMESQVEPVMGIQGVRKMKRINKLHLCSLMMAISGALLSGNVSAKLSNDNVDAFAGIEPALELTCSDINFGVWRLKSGSRGNVTKITLPADGATATADVGAALSTSNGYQAPARSSCQLKGSTAPDATASTVTLANATNVSFTGTNSNNFANTLKAPVAAATLTANFVPSTLAPVISGGGTQFYIGGDLTIPDNLIDNNYGSYKTVTPITITLEDGQQ
ncbi:MAG: hypothetical protein ACRC8I_01345, partial [Plesiomonas shigelloides]